MVSQIITKFNEKLYNEIVEEYLPKSKSLYLECFSKWHEKDSKLTLFLRKFSTTGMYLRAIHECLSALERLRKYQEYIDLVNELMMQNIYGINYRGRWCIRAALICHSHLKNHELAIQICRIGLEDCSIRSGNRLELFTRLLKMVKVKKEDVSQFEKLCPDYYCLHYNEKVIYADFRSVSNENSNKNFFTVTLSTGEVTIMSVENIVINHYLKNGYSNGIHCESSLYHTLLGLLFWDIIYSVNIGDSFRYHKQILPLDLNYASFYEQRKSEIDSRILQISNYSEEDLISQITLCWNKYHGKTSFLISWDTISLEDVLVTYKNILLVY